MTVLKNLKRFLKCLTEENDEGRKQGVDINLVMTEMMSRLGGQAIVVHVW